MATSLKHYRRLIRIKATGYPEQYFDYLLDAYKYLHNIIKARMNLAGKTTIELQTVKQVMGIKRKSSKK